MYIFKIKQILSKEGSDRFLLVFTLKRNVT